MTKLVILKFKKGNFQTGFEVIMQIYEDYGNSLLLMTEKQGRFPPAKDIPIFYERWNSTLSEQDVNIFRNNLKQWFNSSEERKFQDLKNELHINLNPQDMIIVLIQTENVCLQKLPWNEWEFFTKYTQAGIAVSVMNFKKPKIRKINHQVKMNILVILGNSDSVNEEELRLLTTLKSVYSIFLLEPKHSEIISELGKQNWHIIFFSYNQNENLTIEQLKLILKQAIKHGLQLAIFNVRDGLKLTNGLTELEIPLIVMQKHLPNQVAQAFLKFFLQAFSRELPLDLAVRQAKERLHEIWDDEYPGTSWLPVIYQNSIIYQLKWTVLESTNDDDKVTEYQKKQLYNQLKTDIRKQLIFVVLILLILLFVITGIFKLGALLNISLKQYLTIG